MRSDADIVSNKEFSRVKFCYDNNQNPLEDELIKNMTEGVLHSTTCFLTHGEYFLPPNNLQKDKNHQITVCKHSAARSAVEQLADVLPAFALFKALFQWGKKDGQQIDELLFEMRIQHTPPLGGPPMKSGSRML